MPETLDLNLHSLAELNDRMLRDIAAELILPDGPQRATFAGLYYLLMAVNGILAQAIESGPDECHILQAALQQDMLAVMKEAAQRGYRK